MKEENLILEVGGEGGSIKLIRNGSIYFYTTDETTMMDIFPGEFNIEDLKSASPEFPTFDQSMKSLIQKYPIFSLHPLHINPEYQQRITIYFNRYLVASKDQELWDAESWKQILNYQ